jgi:ABC-type phosphate transport system permease subunit
MDGESEFGCRLARSAAVTVLLMVIALIAVLAHASIPTIKTFGASFLWNSDWRPNELEVPKKDANGHIIRDEDGNNVTETIPASFGALPVISERLSF